MVMVMQYMDRVKEKARGRFCKGRERELLGQRAAQIGPVPTYLEQFAYAKENEIEFGNRTSIRSLPVIKVDNVGSRC